VGGRADDLVVDTLLDDVGSPAGRACDDEQRGEHGGGYTHHVVRDGGEPVEVGEHLLDVPHHGFQTLGDVEHLGVAGRDGQLAGDFLDDLVARVGNGVDRVAKADDHFLVFHAATDIGLGFVGGLVALLDFEGHFVGTAVLGTTQRTDGTGYGRVHVGTRAGDDAAGERGRVEFVLCVKDQRDVHRLDPFFGGFFAMQQAQEVAAGGVVVGFDVDHAAIMAVVVPVQQRRAQASHQAIGDVARIGNVVIVFLGQQATQHRYGCAHDVHRVAGGRQGLEGRLQLNRQAT